MKGKGKNKENEEKERKKQDNEIYVCVSMAEWSVSGNREGEKEGMEE